MKYVKIPLAKGINAKVLAWCCNEYCVGGCIMEHVLLNCPLGIDPNENPQPCWKITVADWEAVLEEDDGRGGKDS